MPRDLILGTAGHIDHGKTSLVKALTGIDCDRLPEEKARGITIDIGFAHLALGEFRLGIVDVPGHERFVRNMLAGATGVDLALLVVAADDSIMPQTREHLEILSLLGLRRGVIALAKADLVDEESRQVVEMEIRELVHGTFLADAPIIPTSAISGLGIGSLRQALLEAARAAAIERPAGWFRMSIDRAFVVQGHGTVVTGSVVSGSIRAGDELDWHTGDGHVERVRVRSLNNHGMAVEEVSRGQRAGVNLAGVAHDRVRRGQELSAPGYLKPSRVITVQLFASRERPRPLKHRLPVRLHVGAAEVMAAVSLLEGDQLAAGASGLAQLFLDEPVTTVWGQPFVLRDSPAEHTLAGGRVVHPVAGKIRRRHLEALEQLEQLAGTDVEARAAALAWLGGIAGVEPADLVRSAGIAPDDVPALIERARDASRLVELVLPHQRKRLVHAGRLVDVEAQVLAVLAAMHAENPLVTAHDRQRVLARLDYLGDEPLLQAVADRLIAARKVVGDGRRIARSDFKPKLSINQRKLKDRIVAAHEAAGFQPPEPGSFANLAGGNAAALADIYEVAVAEGFLAKVTDELYLSSAAEAELRARVAARLREGPGLTVAAIRDLLGTTRKYAVPLCEYLDRIGITRREGDLRLAASSLEEKV